MSCATGDQSSCCLWLPQKLYQRRVPQSTRTAWQSKLPLEVLESSTVYRWGSKMLEPNFNRYFQGSWALYINHSPECFGHFGARIPLQSLSIQVSQVSFKKQVLSLNLRGLTTSSHQIFSPSPPGMKNSIHPPRPSHLGSVWAADPTGRLLRGRSPVFFLKGGGRWLVGGWTNTIEKYESKWESSPGRGENKTYLKPPPSWCIPLKSQTRWIFEVSIMGKETIKHCSFP